MGNRQLVPRSSDLSPEALAKGEGAKGDGERLTTNGAGCRLWRSRPGGITPRTNCAHVGLPTAAEDEAVPRHDMTPLG